MLHVHRNYKAWLGGGGGYGVFASFGIKENLFQYKIKAQEKLVLNKIHFICNNTLTTEQLGRATSQIVTAQIFINDVTNINFIDSKANIKGKTS